MLIFISYQLQAIFNTLYAYFLHIKARVYSKHDQHEQAIKYIYSALAIKPNKTVLAVNLISELNIVNRPKEAISFAEQWLAQGHTSSAYFWNHKGIAHSKLGQHEQDVNCHRAALDLEPNDEIFAGNLIQALYDADRAKEAISFAEEWLAEGNKAGAHFWNSKGIAYYGLWQHKLQSAICFHKALSVEPDDSNAAGNLIGELYPDEAISFAEEWLLNPRHTPNADFLNTKGIAHHRLKQYHQSVECFSAALALESRNEVYASNLILALGESNLFQEAISFAETWLTQGNTPTAYFWSEKGLAHSSLKQHEKGIECLHIALSLEPNNARYVADLIQVLHKASLAQEAISFAETWLAQGNTPNSDVWNEKAIAHEQLAQYDQTIACFYQALALEPNNADFADELMRVFNQTKRSQEAFNFADEWLAQGHTPNAYFNEQLAKAQEQLGGKPTVVSCF